MGYKLVLIQDLGVCKARTPTTRLPHQALQWIFISSFTECIFWKLHSSLWGLPGITASTCLLYAFLPCPGDSGSSHLHWLCTAVRWPATWTCCSFTSLPFKSYPTHVYTSSYFQNVVLLVVNNMLIIDFLKQWFVYLEVTVTERERHKADLPSACLLPKWPQWPGLGQTNCRSFIWISHMGGKGLKTWAILWCFSQMITKEWDPEWSSQESNQHPYRMPMSERAVWLYHRTNLLLIFEPNHHLIC